MSSNIIKKGILENLIRQIVKGIISESNVKDSKKLSIYPIDFKKSVNYIRIKHSNVPGEFVVAWYINGKFSDDNSYYTSDLKDAFFTFEKLKATVDRSNGLTKEKTTTSAVSPTSTPFAFKKKSMMEDEDKLQGQFVDRGEVKLEGGISPELAEKIANYHWDIIQSNGKDERGVFNFKTRGDRWCCAVGLLNGQPAILSITTTPGRLQLLSGNEAYPTNLKEMTTTGAVSGFSTPCAFSRKGGSEKGIEGSAALGYTMTPEGDQEMKRSADKLLEGNLRCKLGLHSWGKQTCNKIKITGTHQR